MSAPRRILVVDDHSMFRLGLSALLNSVPGLVVVGEAATGLEAVAAAATLRPDVIVMDLNLPGFGGLEATERIVRAQPGAGVLVLTMYDSREQVLAAIRVGARGYILKTARQEEIVRAVHAVGDGGMIFGQPVAVHVCAFLTDLPVRKGNELTPLTPREREVLTHIARGESNAAIARLLVVSPKTVRNHITSIFRKLGVADREQAIKRTRDCGPRWT
jgi:DNA-binding NarL/FixJ family response regulator